MTCNNIIQFFNKVRTLKDNMYGPFLVATHRKIFPFKQLTDIVAVPEIFTILRPDAVPEVRNVASLQQIKRTYQVIQCLPSAAVQRHTPVTPAAQQVFNNDFLDAIRDDIIVLVRTKGYTLTGVRDTLKNAGYEVGEKALRDIIREAESKKPSRRSSSKTAPKKTDSGRKDGIDMNNN